MLPKNRDTFLRLLKNKGFKEERMIKVRVYTIGKSTTLESNKSLVRMLLEGQTEHEPYPSQQLRDTTAFSGTCWFL
jgi:hypothetical protein